MRCGSHGSVITAAGDERVTRAGQTLRKFKLDELPQLFNVLTGDMSLVGPRPEVPEYVQTEAPIWETVLKVRPGITDLATLIYRHEERILGTSADPNAFYRESVLPAKLHLNRAYLRTEVLLARLEADLADRPLQLVSGRIRSGPDEDIIRRGSGK